MNGSLLETVRQPQAMPSGTLVLPFGGHQVDRRLDGGKPFSVVTSVSGVIGSVVQL